MNTNLSNAQFGLSATKFCYSLIGTFLNTIQFLRRGESVASESCLWTKPETSRRELNRGIFFLLRPVIAPARPANGRFRSPVAGSFDLCCPTSCQRGRCRWQPCRVPPSSDPVRSASTPICSRDDPSRPGLDANETSTCQPHSRTSEASFCTLRFLARVIHALQSSRFQLCHVVRC